MKIKFTKRTGDDFSFWCEVSVGSFTLIKSIVTLTSQQPAVTLEVE